MAGWKFLAQPFEEPLAKIGHQRCPPLPAPLPHTVLGWERGSGANMTIHFRVGFRVQPPGQLHALQAEI